MNAKAIVTAVAGLSTAVAGMGFYRFRFFTKFVSNQMPVTVICYSVYETLSYLMHDLTEVKTGCLILV